MEVRGASRREIDHDSNVALGVSVVREEGVVVPMEQNMHLLQLTLFLEVLGDLCLDLSCEGNAAITEDLLILRNS